MTILLRGCNLYHRRIWSKITVVFINVSVRWFSRLRESVLTRWLYVQIFVLQKSKTCNPQIPVACTRGHYTHTVPFKSKLTLDFRSSRESRIENRDSILDCCVSIRDSRFLRDSSNRNGLCLVSSNSLSTLDTRLLRESTSNNLCSSLTYWLLSLNYYKHTLHLTYVTLQIYVTYLHLSIRTFNKIQSFKTVSKGCQNFSCSNVL